MRQPRAVTDKRYEEKHKEERKAKSLVWGTSVPRQFAEEINEFLSQYGFTKVQLIEAGYKALLDEAAEHDLGLAKSVTHNRPLFAHDKFSYESSEPRVPNIEPTLSLPDPSERATPTLYSSPPTPPPKPTKSLSFLCPHSRLTRKFSRNRAKKGSQITFL